MKRALVVDRENAAEDFGRTALELYDLTVVRSLQEAEAMVSGADYDLVLVATQDGLCLDAMWMMVERIAKLSPDAACVLIHVEEADAAFHARASALGVSVVTAPVGAAVEAALERAKAVS